MSDTFRVKMIIAYLRKEEVIVLKAKGVDTPFPFDEDIFFEEVCDGSRNLNDIAGRVPVLKDKGIYTLTAEICVSTIVGYLEPLENDYSFEFVGHELLYKFPEEW